MKPIKEYAAATLVVFVIVVIVGCAIALNVRLYQKAGGDIRAANAQERMATALERIAQSVDEGDLGTRVQLTCAKL